jgi:SpoVK/Ycf46/Vps4 family AAA+-type ATPase
MAERKSSVFMVATANVIDRLPPELVRKGRFDELFFVDLPSIEDRTEILDIALRHRGVSPSEQELVSLATASAGFSGAELDAAITAASYSGAITAAAVASELAATVPLAHARASEIAALRSWATDHARAA